MSAVNEVAGGTLGELNFAASAAAALMLPLSAELDAFLNISLGPLSASLQLQLSASLDFALDASLGLTLPTISLQLLLDASIALQAAIQAALAVGFTMPGISFSLDASIAASLDLAASLQLQLGLLDLQIQAMLAIKIPVIELAAQIQASVSAGPLILLEMTSAPLATLGTDIAAKFASGVTFGPNSIGPGDTAFGYMFVAKGPNLSVAAGLDFLFLGI